MHSLALKLTLSFLAVSLTATLLLSLLSREVTVSEFGHFMVSQNQGALVTQFEDYYRVHGDWENIENEMFFSGEMMNMQGMQSRDTRNGIILADSAGYVIVTDENHHLGEQLSRRELSHGLSIQVDGQQTGTLILESQTFVMMSSAGEEFLSRVNRALVIAALGSTAISLLLGILLARTLMQPIRELTAATQLLAEGQLGQQVKVRSNDELGGLAASFNSMSLKLAHARDQRRQMTADIAHDLRTPLSVILGYTEGLLDGVLLPTPETFSLVHAEAIHLNRLVEDLRLLSQVDTGELSLHRQQVLPQRLLERAAAAHTPHAKQKKITLQTEIAPNLPKLDIDPDRIAQVLDNLLDNALRYTPANGSVTLTAEQEQDAILINIRDTGIGISPEELSNIFDRFYRTDTSRRENNGGSGLGLSIAKSLVEAHGGRIWATSTGEGSTLSFSLPLSN